MSAVDKLRTQKMKRNEAKKRKLEAFLELVRQDEANFVPKEKKSGASFQESYKALKDELNRYKKKKSPNPLFTLKDGGRDAIVTLKSNDLVCNSPLFSEDLMSLLLTSVLGQISPSPLNWAKFEHAHNTSKTVLLEIKGVPQSDIIKLQSKFNENGVVFPYIIEIISSNVLLATQLSMLSQYYCQNKENYSTMFPIDHITDNKNKESDSGNKISKLHLLLSPIQLAMEHFPLPHSAFAESNSEGYCFSKEKYSPVHEGSPMFALDCEMCRSATGQELTRIAIVDEKLDTVYHTLVKPRNDIIDYCTRYSGITESMLRDVTTRLEKVQNDIREFLPNDAILCGQSLNCDLHALKMIHPYVIDTSVIFNQWGVRQRKISLKRLAQIHLKMNIQCAGPAGHNPIEDSLATMKLVQLKLKKCLGYGDAVISSIATADKTQKNLEFRKQDVVYDNVFFSALRKFSKKVCLIGSEGSLKKYRPAVIRDNVSKVTKLEIIENMKAITENLENNHLILSHLVLDSEKCVIEQVNDGVKQLYSSFPADTLFVIYISDVQILSRGNMRKNYCMVTLKSENTASVWNLNSI